ncbi:MAG: hypothetical protein HY674_13345, partial [Chloroflexi bacterium]|nr:hypothetical protein [Chloroflexota bacterium]
MRANEVEAENLAVALMAAWWMAAGLKCFAAVDAADAATKPPLENRGAQHAAVSVGAGAQGQAGPVAWWRFDEGAGTLARDSSGSGYHGSLRGAARWVDGMSGQALLFDGSSHVEVPFHEKLLLGNAITIQAYIYPTDHRPNTYKHIVEVWDSYLLRLDNPPEGGKLSFFTFLDGTPEPRIQAGIPATSKWHQVFAVWDGSKMQLWLDGVKRESARAGRPAPKARPLRIGPNFLGAIDELKIYNRALTENEILDQVPPKLKAKLSLAHPVFDVGKPFTLSCEISNTGGQPLQDGTVEVTLPEGLDLLEGGRIVTVPVVTRTASRVLQWKLQANAAVASVVKVAAGFRGMDAVVKTTKVVVARPIPSGGDLLEKPTLMRMGNDLILGNKYLRLVFPANDFGYGVFAVDVNKDRQWQRMALANCLSYVAVKHDQEIERHFIWAQQFKPLIGAAGQAGIEFSGITQDGAGRKWSSQFSFTLADQDRVKVEYETIPDQDGSLVVLQGPTLYVGEGTFGVKKDDGLFCGLEWLVGDEASSSNLDMHDPDYYVRFVPHPNKITIPLMAFGKDGAAIALYWDCLQKWDGTNTRPAAVFSSPNFIDHQENNLMGLFLPSVPEWVGQNNLEAAKTPCPIRKETPLRLTAWITCVTPAKQSIACLPRWFETFGVPAPAPLPRGDYVKEIEFSMRAFFESLWIESEQKWWTTKGAGELLSGKALPPHYAFQLRMAAAMTADESLRRKYNDRAALAERLGGFTSQWDDLGFTWGSPAATLLGLGNRAAAHLDSMGDDGSWRFRTRIETNGIFKGMDYALLGPDKAAEVGTCARNAYEILRFARMTGDAETFGAVEPSLKFMEQFTVPRAAQVWECPVHSPDILAAADAVEAYLEAYRYAGDRHFLDEAIRWAWRGLPFLYMWNPPGNEMLRYASIAILGGSWYAGSWIGQPVQWNGLRYAYAVLKLADHDQTMPWKKIGEGITISAMYQQDATGPNVALWPDSFSALDASKSSWVFEPGMIMKNVCRILDRDIEPATTMAGTGKERLMINSRAKVSEVSWNKEVLKFISRFPHGESGYVMIASIDKPTQVRLNGAPLLEAQGDLQNSIAEAWKYASGQRFLALRLESSGPYAIEIDGAKYRSGTFIPRRTGSIDFDFENDFDGWMPAHQVENLRVEEGLLKGRATGADPYLHRVRLEVNGNLCTKIVVKARATTGNNMALYWTTDQSPNWGENKAMHLGFTPGQNFNEYVFDVGQHQRWAGKSITGLRLDPLEGGSGGDFEVDYVKGNSPRFISAGFAGDAFKLVLQPGP